MDDEDGEDAEDGTEADRWGAGSAAWYETRSIGAMMLLLWFLRRSTEFACLRVTQAHNQVFLWIVAPLAAAENKNDLHVFEPYCPM